MRDAPSIPLINALVERGAEVRAFDPVAREQAEQIFSGIEFADDAYAAAEGADALVIVTEWDEFRALDLEKVARSMRGKVLVDLRNVYDREEAEAGRACLYRRRPRPAGDRGGRRLASHRRGFAHRRETGQHAERDQSDHDPGRGRPAGPLDQPVARHKA